MQWDYQVDWIRFPTEGPKGVAQVSGMAHSFTELLALRGGDEWELTSLESPPNVDAIVAVFKRPRSKA